jgi:hypothetical protein
MDKFKQFSIGDQRAESVAAPLIKVPFPISDSKVITSFPVSQYVVYPCSGVSLQNRQKKSTFSLACDEVFSLEKEIK